MIERLESIEAKYNEITKELTTPEVLNNVKTLTELSKKQSSLEETVTLYKRYKEIEKNIKEDTELLKDPELKEMAKEELQALEIEKEELTSKLEVLLLPKDENDDKNIIMELRINGKAVPSNYEISNDALVQNITISSRIGRKIYIKGLEFVYLLAVQELYGDYTKVSIKHSLDKAIYTELNLTKGIDGNDVAAIKKQMKKIIDKDYEINKISASREDIIEYVNKLGESI